MTVSPTSPSRNLRVFAKVAHAAPSGGVSRRVAAVVRFYLKGAQPRGPLLQETPPPAAPAPTVQKTFQFGELRAFLEAGTARAAVAGMLSLLALDLEADCFQAWVGFISSVLGLAALRSRRRNLGGMIAIVRIDCSGAAEWGNEGEEGRDGFPPAAPSAKAEAATSCGTGEDGGGGIGVGGCSCPICYEALPDGVEVARTPCGHRFHEACIGRWLRSRRTCPVCRFEMPKKLQEV